MKLIEIILMGLSLSMDAFAVALCKGLTINKKKEGIILSLYFSFFQMIMPIIGNYLASIIMSKISQIDHWLAFIILSVIGFNMILSSPSKETQKEDVSPKTMIPLAIATSIDALAVGITFAVLNVNLIEAVIIIGSITFSMSFLGVKIGNHFGNHYEFLAEKIGGGMILIIGLKILLEHLNP